ncbi:MAG: hypothetical protein IPI39_09185 [Candidatus Obscuribacter sp.]|nr:hypothetical protein [Candidatus Obscuribacter sp.]
MTKLKIEAEAMLKIKIAAVILVVIAFVSDVALCEKKGEHLEVRNQSSAKQFIKGGNERLWSIQGAVMSSGTFPI